MLEQANAYRSLANGGRFAPFRLRATDPAGGPRQILSPQAAWIVADIMADPSARAGTFGVDSALRLPFWAAAKTGTSKAMRDNWCVGFTDRYTVAVWVGNLEGDSMKAVSGTSGAAPVWRDVMMALHRGQPGRGATPSGRCRSQAGFIRKQCRTATERLVPDGDCAVIAGICPAHLSSPAHHQSGFGQRLRAGS